MKGKTSNKVEKKNAPVNHFKETNITSEWEGIFLLLRRRSDVGLRTIVFNRGLLRQAWCHGTGLMRAGPSGELHGARLSSVPTGDRSANPASVPGRSGLQRALLLVSSTRKHSGAERLAAPLGVSRAARAAVPCRSSASGHRSSSSKYTRSQFKIVAWGHNVSVPSIRERGLRT